MLPHPSVIGTFAENLANKQVVATCDNLPLVHCLNKLSSRNPQVMYFMRPLVLLLLRHNIAYIADSLSRRQVSRGWLVRHGKDPKLVSIPAELRPEALTSVSTL